MSYEAALWLAYDVLRVAAFGCFFAVVVDGFLRDRKEADRGR